MSRSSPNQPLLNRRQFLGGAAGEASSGKVPFVNLPPEFRNERRIELLKSRGVVRLFLGNHRIPENPETVQGAQMVIVEAPIPPSNQTDVDVVMKQLYRDFRQIGVVLEEARKTRTPVFMVDMTYLEGQQMGVDFDARAAFWISMVEMLAGLGEAWQAVKLPVPDEGQYRRSLSQAALGLVATYLLTPAAGYAIKGVALSPDQQPDVHTFEFKVWEWLNRFNLKAHPEINMTLDLRDALIAQLARRAIAIMEKELPGEEPIVANMYMGAMHGAGVENYLDQTEAQRMKIIKKESRSVPLSGVFIRIDWLLDGSMKLTFLADPAFEKNKE